MGEDTAKFWACILKFDSLPICGKVLLSSVQSAARVAEETRKELEEGEKKRKEKRKNMSKI